MGTNQKFQDFIGVVPVSKTLRNELIPTEITKGKIEELSFLEEDKLRAQNREKVKEWMDDYYRDVIECTLQEDLPEGWENLFACMRSHKKQNTKETKKELEQMQNQLRAQIHARFAARDDFKEMFAAPMISKLLPAYIAGNPAYADRQDECKEILAMYKGFTTSLGNYFKTRENIFSKEKISTAVGYRIVEDNAEIFLNNEDVYQRICKLDGFESEQLDSSIQEPAEGRTLKEICSDAGFGRVLTQKGIDRYNEIVGIVNQFMNLYCQKNKLQKPVQFRLKRLHKQILCKGTSSFEIPKQFENDEQVYQAINAFTELLTKNHDMDRLITVAEHVNEYDTKGIYISSDAYSTVSHEISKKWNLIEDSLTDYYNDTLPGKGKSKETKVRKAVKEEEYRSVSQLNDIIQKYYIAESNQFVWKVESYILSLAETIKPELCREIACSQKGKLIEDDKKIAEIKEMLDMYMKVFHVLKAFQVQELLNRDEAFYSEVDEIYQDMQDIVPLYNRVRNYVTQKPYTEGKYRLYFKTPTLADGWSKSKEYDYNAILMMKDEKYYLGILNAQSKPSKDILAGKEEPSDGAYRKMNYYLLPGPSKMLPKVFLSKKGCETYNPSEYIVDGYNHKRHIKSSKEFDIQFCRDLIDYFKDCIEKHPEWKKFNFEFSETNSYEDISGFYQEVEKQGYRIEWTYICEDDIRNLQENGQLFLFQIYNKDFAAGSTGKPNLHTLYFKNLFSKENLQDIVLKLNGEAELFYREKSIQKPVGHKTGTVLVNRTYELEQRDTNGEGIIKVKKSFPENVYTELYQYYKNGENGKLSAESARYIDKVQCHMAKLDILKDRRYTENKYFIHLPITINYKAEKRNDLNAIAQRYITKQDDVHVIGIDRGERNLIYVSVINMKGEIVEQKSFNVVEQNLSAGTKQYYDYKGKLENREKERDEARKSWKTIGKIKELKEGYLSTVIHEIAQMVIKYNAIIAMEDLNYGFKRGRFKVERQVYQKFENMLISKLNYLTDKSLPVDEPGGILRGYQMTCAPDSIKNPGRQNGIIFYVPSAYTSKIDPTTGFVDAFRWDVASTNDAKRNFLMKLEALQYDKQRDMFRFSFDYKNFDVHRVTLAKTKWDVYTNGTRVKNYKENGYSNSAEINLTDEMKRLLKDADITYQDGCNILDTLQNQERATSIIDGILEVFRLTVQLRNSKSNDPNYDRIISPVLNKNGEFFDSAAYKQLGDRQASPLPIDADANGAYCIALKGLYSVNQIKENWKEGEKLPADCLKINHADWFAFMQGERAC